MKLYRVKTTVPEFEGCKDVVLSWFVSGRQAPVERPYAELIEGYDPADADYQQGAVKEFFDEAEAAAFVAWLKASGHNEEHRISEAELPLPKNVIGLGAIPIDTGWGVGGLTIRGQAEALGFEVTGYYDLRHYEQIDVSNEPSDLARRYRDAYPSDEAFRQGLHDVEGPYSVWQQQYVPAAASEALEQLKGQYVGNFRTDRQQWAEIPSFADYVLYLLGDSLSKRKVDALYMDPDGEAIMIAVGGPVGAMRIGR